MIKVLWLLAGVSGVAFLLGAATPLVVLPVAGAEDFKLDYAVPRPDVTPGDTRPGNAVEVCRQTTAQFRKRGDVSRAKIRAEYGEPKRGGGYVYDHLVPLGVGGANTTANLWPQPRGEAKFKDRCEVLARRAVCSTGFLPLADAQRGFAQDWVGFCRSLGTEE